MRKPVFPLLALVLLPMPALAQISGGPTLDHGFGGVSGGVTIRSGDEPVLPAGALVLESEAIALFHCGSDEDCTYDAARSGEVSLSAGMVRDPLTQAPGLGARFALDIENLELEEISRQCAIGGGSTGGGSAGAHTTPDLEQFDGHLEANIGGAGALICAISGELFVFADLSARLRGRLRSEQGVAVAEAGLGGQLDVSIVTGETWDGVSARIRLSGSETYWTGDLLESRVGLGADLFVGGRTDGSGLASAFAIGIEVDHAFLTDESDNPSRAPAVEGVYVGLRAGGALPGI